MIRVSIQFETDNAAFEENPAEAGRLITEAAIKAAHALVRHQIAGRDLDAVDGGNIYDANGNFVGRWELEGS